MPNTLYQRRSSILFGDIGEDVVALSLERGLCYGMENVTAAVWTLLAEPRSLDDLCSTLMDQYDVTEEQCRGDVASLLSEMIEEGLVEQVKG